MGSTISCRVSAANAGKSRRMGKAKRTAAADEPAGAEGGTNASAGDDGLIALLAAGLRLQASDNLWRVSGNTLPHRLILRDAGGALKFAQRVVVCDSSRFDTLVALPL